jgi:PIN domain nuclease of toxin-antitoxin system
VSRILLDTHVFIWWVEADSRVAREWVELIVDADNEVYVSAVTAWEIETKKRIGELAFDHDVTAKMREFEFAGLPISLDHASAAGALDWNHRDPFDRILVAQASREYMTLLSADSTVKSAPGVRVL